MTAAAPTVSVVVPTYRRPEDLERLLPRLRPQIEGRGRQLVVVNDGSHDAAYERIVAPHAGWLDYVASPANVGPSGARNLGAARADGAFLVFVDDDCQPPPFWLDWLDSTLAANPDADAVGGTTRPVPSATPRLFEQFLAESGWHPRPLIQDGQVLLFVTANLAVRRSMFEAVGGFDEAIRTTEDRNLTWRLKLRGAVLHLDPDWYVDHVMSASPAQHLRRHFGYGLGIPRQIRLEGCPPDRVYWHPDARPRGWWLQRALLSLDRARDRSRYSGLPGWKRRLFTLGSALTLLTMDLGFSRAAES